MTNKWTLLKSIISALDRQDELFLSILDDDGHIVSANSRMIRTLGMPHPRNNRVSFLNLLHPVNLDNFRDAMAHCRNTGHPSTTELWIKNGHYHPMRWEMIALETGVVGERNYFCAGHKLGDEERVRKFNQLGSRHYQHIVEGLSEGVLLQDVNGSVIYVNQRVAQIFDTTLRRLYELTDIQQAWDHAWTILNDNGEKLSFADSPFMRAIRTGQRSCEHISVRLRSGEIRRVRISSQPLKDEKNGTSCAIISSICDMSHVKELSLQLKQSDDLFYAFMNQTPNLAWVVDEDTHLLQASRSFYRYFGLDEKIARGRKISELVPADIFNALVEKHLRVLEKGEPVDVTEKIKWADGSRFYFHINIFSIEGVNGKRLLGGHAVNVAEKYAVEKQLRLANERLLLLSRASTNAIWEWDMQSGYIFRNDALMDMIGYQAEDTKGLTWWFRRIHPEDRDRVSDKVKESTDKGQLSWEDEYRFKCADGTYKHMLDKGYIVYENGLPVRMIGSLQDVTDLKKLENALVREKLEHQRTISETVIRVQEKERTRIGHELHDNVNQILSTTKLFVDMLTPGSEEEQKIKEKSTEYLMLAIEEIRKLSRELVTPQLKSRTLVESIQQLIDDIRVSTSLQIRFTFDHHIELLGSGQKITLFRIIQEQIKNILKYSKAGQAEILLMCRDNEVRLTIRDNGVGFDMSLPVKGIGLSSIQERARFYSGELKVSSSPGNGCTLEVFLPIIGTAEISPEREE